MHASAKSASASFTDSVGASDESQKNLMLRIGIMSPEKIRTFSLGEVLNGKTLHQHPPHKPIQDGLFCERIFGPVPTEKDSHSQKEAKLKVRQEQFGRIELACPIAHAWFTNAIPSAIGTILNLSTKEIQQVIYFRAHLVVIAKPVSDLGAKRLFPRWALRPCLKPFNRWICRHS
jgi:DNA-directed RNA polymerase beta' subunit